MSPDQKRLAVFENTADRRIRIIDLATFRDIASIPVAVSQSVHEYRFTPDGANLAVTEYLGTMRLYDVTTGRLRLERGPVGHVVFSPDGRTMAAGNLAGTVDVVELRE